MSDLNTQSRPAIAASVGVAWWKRGPLGRTLRALGHAARFDDGSAAAVAAAARRHGAVGTWAAREPPELAALAYEAGVCVVRIEDGFLRSVGLGSDFVPAASIVLDRRGVYFDPTGPSDLEHVLEHAAMDGLLLARARALREQIVRLGLTKYNSDRRVSAAERAPVHGPRVLVPGQVEDDRSVQRGGAGVRGNLDLLRRVRARAPDAVITYKPHPDVEAGHRVGAVPDGEVLAYADRIVRDVSITALFREVDAVHTLTSLSGFEALLRGLPVETYGQPFYAGWGLTTDHAPPLPRRTRRLTLDMLTAGALLLYPFYVDPMTGEACEAEQVVARLAAPGDHRPSALVAARRLQGRILRRLPAWVRTTATRAP